ncbi:MAG: hypothetical protein ISS28_01935 [Candidatus Cloacimonetes bacterium]|nr:hypothetical protein [Candidatus Cloacimonadota bacterium]MBL7085848.1 hypothetical protein [Candidatus Cloacimonadota bacterium]
MSITYINRKKDKYYLHEVKTKKGNLKYFFSKRKEGKLVNEIPEGYEIYENPNAQVFLRRIQPRLVTEEELKIINNGIRQYSSLKNFKIDIKRNIITIFLPDRDEKDLEDLLKIPIFKNKQGGIIEFLTNHITYSPMMRFVLIDKEERIYEVERYCFRGRVDGWISLECSSNLKKLVHKYCPHLGKDSFYDLI